MTIEQKTIELQSVSPPLTRNQIIAELGKWQAEQSMQETEGVLVEKQTPEVVKNQEPVEEEVVENEEVIEEEGNQEVVADQQDAAVTTTPENASEEEDTESPSEDGSSESQETEEDTEPFDLNKINREINEATASFRATVNKRKAESNRTNTIQNYLQTEFKDVNSEVDIPNIGEEIQGKGGFTYKYTADVDDEGNLDLQVFYKGKDDEEFINATEKARNNPKSVTLNNQEASIQSALGFLSEDVADNLYKQRKAREAALKQKQQQDFDPNREGTQSFDDMLLYNYEQQLLTTSKEKADLKFDLNEIELAKSRKKFQELLEDPDNKKLVERKIENKKQELSNEINSLDPNDPEYKSKLDKLNKQIKELDTEQGILSVISGQSIVSFLDKKLEEMLPEIEEQAVAFAAIKPFDEKTGLGVVDGVFDIEGNIKFRRNALAVKYEDQMSPVYYEDEDLLEQKALYDQAKKIYAKKNKVNVNSVTLDQARPIVEELYAQKIYSQKEHELLENYSKTMLEVKAQGKAPTVLFTLATGFKSFQDIFDDTKGEKRVQLEAAAKKLDADLFMIKDSLATQNVADRNLQLFNIVNGVYKTQEQVDEAREKFNLLLQSNKSDIQFIKNNLDLLSDKVKDKDQALLFNSLYSRNYGFLTGLPGGAISTTLDTFVNGLAEYSERMGINMASFGMTGAVVEGIYNKLTGEDLSRKLTDKFTGAVDNVVNIINDEMALPTTINENKTLMDWGRWASTSFGQQLPIYAVLYGTGGAGLPIIGMATAGSKFREMQKEIDLGTADYNIFQMYAMAHLVGGSAIATEYITQGMLGRLKFNYQNIPGFKVGFNDTMKGFLSAGGRWARDMGEEIPSEILDNLIGNIGDKYILDKKDVNVFDGTKETVFSTLWTAGVAVRAPLIGRQLLAPFQSKQSYQVIGENTARVAELNEMLTTGFTAEGGLSADVTQTIQEEINSLSVENMKVLNTEFQRLDKMTDEEKRILLDNKAKEYEIVRKIRNINNDLTLDQKTKELTIDTLQKNLNNIATSSAQVLAPYIIEENKAKNEAILQKSIEKVEKVTKKVLGEGINVIDDMNNLPEGVPKFVDAYVDPKTNQIYINKEWAASVGAVTAAEHELLHKIQKSLFDTNPAKALEVVEDFKNTLGKKERRLIEERLDANYRFKMDDEGNFILDEDGNKQKKEEIEYAEEYFNIFSDLVGNKEIGFTDNLGENLLRFVNKLKELVYKPAGFKNLEYKSGRDAYNFIKDYNKSIKKGEVSERAEALIKKGALTTSDRTSPSITTRGQEFIDLSNEGVYNNESLVEIINSPSSNQTDRFAAMEAIVETNWPVISKGLKFNPTGSIPMDAVKTAVTEQMQGIFPGRNKELLADFNPETAQVNTYLGSLMGQRQAEILERAKQIGGVTREGASIDSDVARQVVDTTTKETTTKRSRTPKAPTETVKYSDTIIEKAGVKNKAELETKITEATTESFKDVDVERFGQTKDVPPAVAEIYGGMLGLNPETITNKDRTYQNYDEEGLNAAQRFLLANAASDYARLPKTKDETTTRGRGTFIPKNMKDALYTDGKLTGTLKDYMDLLRSKPTGPLYRDSKYAQLIRGLLNTHIRNRMFETLVPTTPQRLRGGAKFSITDKNKIIKEAIDEVENKGAKKFLEKTLSGNLDADAIETEIGFIEDTAKILGVDFTDAVDFLFTNEKRYKELRSKFNVRAGGKNEISSAANAARLKKAYTSLIKRMIPKGESFSNLPKSMQQAIMDTVGFGDARFKIGGKPFTLQEYGLKRGEYSKLMQAVFGKDALIGTGTNLGTRDNVFAPRNWGEKGFRGQVEKIADSYNNGDITLDEARVKVEDLLTPDKKTDIDDVLVANQRAVSDTYVSLIEMFAADPTKENFATIIDILESQVNRATGIFKGLIPVTSFSIKPEKGTTKGKTENKRMHNEHLVELFNANKNFLNILNKFRKGEITKEKAIFDAKVNAASLEQAVISERVRVEKDADGASVRSFANPLTFLGKDAKFQIPIGTRRLPSGKIFTGTNLAEFIAQELSEKQAKIISTTSDASLSPEGIIVKNMINNKSDYQGAKKQNTEIVPTVLSYSKTSTKQKTNQDIVGELNTLDKALAEGRKVDKPVKKIRVFDFDDTLARSKSKVIVNMPDGSTKKINATQFAEQASTLQSEGAEFDFTEFEQVIDGKKGPLFNVAKKIADTRGTEDLFILTARPQSAAGPIKAFMKALGINIPLKNITGLADGTAAAKGRWIAGKAAEGYNDFYFADDASKNVKAVKDVLDQIDVKSRVQQAKFSKTSTFNTVINDMIQSSSGIESYKKFSAAKARTIGRDKGRYDWLTLASSAEDFKGLLYRLLGDGKQGEAQFEFLKTNLIDTYNRAEDSIIQAKISASNDFMALKEQFPGLPKTLETETGVGKFTYQHALRTYMWTKQGMSIPGLSKADARKLNKFITDDAKLQAFADQLISIQKGKPYPKPGKEWLGGNLTTDIIGGINKVNRAEYQQEWRENVDIIFSPENLNKMEAAYGTRWRKALENSLKRMKAGTNRLGYTDSSNAVLDWVNNSVGAVMFLNTRSALLQTISAVNFLNWGDNNIIKAGQAFANQKQYWSDFMTLMNSDFLVQRRNGLKINVSESEIADAVKDSQNKPKAAIAFLLSKGFVFTRYADSFAIASGGSTFYRNRIKKYLKEGMSQELAQEKAFNDFKDVAEESQQSSDPSKISMQQASGAGRVILNWANTPMQYLRIQKRDLQDLIAGRGDPKVKIARIAYYGVVQNLIFNALQQALFAIGFGDDDEDDEKKKKAKDKKIARVANGMIDSQLKGLGIAGMVMLSAKNTLMKIYEESKQKRPEYEAAAIEALSFSPAISSKYRKFVGGLKSFSWNMKEIKEKGFSLDNPAYLAGAQIITAFTNLPIDRVMKKANNIRGILSEQSQMWQKVSMALGYSSYDIGLPYYGGWDKPVEPTEAELKKQEIKLMKRDTNTAEQTQMLLDLGLTKKEIKALRYEDARVKKIIELQNKKKKDE